MTQRKLKLRTSQRPQLLTITVTKKTWVWILTLAAFILTLLVSALLYVSMGLPGITIILSSLGISISVTAITWIISSLLLAYNKGHRNYYLIFGFFAIFIIAFWTVSGGYFGFIFEPIRPPPEHEKGYSQIMLYDLYSQKYVNTDNITIINGSNHAIIGYVSTNTTFQINHSSIAFIQIGKYYNLSAYIWANKSATDPWINKWTIYLKPSDSSMHVMIDRINGVAAEWNITSNIEGGRNNSVDIVYMLFGEGETYNRTFGLVCWLPSSILSNTSLAYNLSAPFQIAFLAINTTISNLLINGNTPLFYQYVDNGAGDNWTLIYINQLSDNDFYIGVNIWGYWTNSPSAIRLCYGIIDNYVNPIAEIGG